MGSQVLVVGGVTVLLLCSLAWGHFLRSFIRPPHLHLHHLSGISVLAVAVLLLSGLPYMTSALVGGRHLVLF